MALETMYAAANGSIPTALSAMVSATATALPIQDGVILPDPPNLITLGTEDNAEVVLYTQKSATQLLGCVRGYGGTLKQIWPEGTAVYRAYTAADHAAFIANIEALEAAKLAKDGDVANATATFTAAAQPANIRTGEKLSIILGKLARWYNTFGDAAWANFGTAYGTVAEGNHTHAGYVLLTSGKADPAATCAKGVAVTASRALALTDAGCCLNATSAQAITITIPADAAVNLPIDTEIEIAWEGAGRVTIAPQSGVALISVKGTHPSGVALSTRYAVAVLKKKGANDWRITGELA